MIGRAVQEPVETVAAVGQAGYYPTVSCVGCGMARDMYTVSMQGIRIPGARRAGAGPAGAGIHIASIQEAVVKKLQVQGVHHITLVGSTKQSAVDFWQGALGMPFVLEQPNLGKPDENHLYFDPGDGRLLTVFTNESRGDAARHAPREVGCVEHIAFNVSRATFMQAPARLRARGVDFIQRDRGFMDSIYLHDPNGLKIELACYKFEPPDGVRAVDVLMKAHLLRVERGDHHITDEHLADAIERLLAARPRLGVEEDASTPA